jgi:hypothetical protein
MHCGGKKAGPVNVSYYPEGKSTVKSFLLINHIPSGFFSKAYTGL